MSHSLNKATIIGALGKDPDIRSFPNGGKVANLSVATSESWKDKTTGEKKDRTQWHNVAVFNEHLVKICEEYLRKGMKVYIEGAIETRKYEKDGRDVYTTEIVLRPFNGIILMLSKSKDGREPEAKSEPKHDNTMDDEIPF